jgi:hypothetical protein
MPVPAPAEQKRIAEELSRMRDIESGIIEHQCKLQWLRENLINGILL